MKSIGTALGIAALLVATTAAYAATDYSWVGTTSDSWHTASNWSPSGVPGGGAAAGDTATIATNANMPVTVNDTVTHDVYWVVVNADSADADMTLKITNGNSTTGDLDVVNGGDGYIRLVAGSHVTGNAVHADDAKLWHDNGNLEVDNLDLRGGTSSSTRGDRGLAIVDLDVASNSGLAINYDVDVKWEVDIDASANVTITDELRVGDKTAVSGYWADLEVKGGATVTVGCIVIEGGTGFSDNTTVTVTGTTTSLRTQ